MRVAHLIRMDSGNPRLRGPVVAIGTPYIQEFVEEIKAKIPGHMRAWVPTAKVWVASESYYARTLRDLAEKHVGPICQECADHNICPMWAPFVVSFMRACGYFFKPTGRHRESPPPPPRAHAPHSSHAEAIKYLGLAPPITVSAIKRAFAMLALKCHPDTGGTNAEMIRLLSYRDLLLRSAASR